jgi:Thiamine pyrophosphate enzyme, central domain
VSAPAPRLAALGVEAVYGAPLAGVPVAEAADPTVAALLAAAHLLVHRTRCAVHEGEGRLRLLGRGSAPAEIDLGDAHSSAGPPPEGSERWVEPDAGDVARIDAAETPVVLVGPGLADRALVPGLHALAAAGGLGVLNTWGAKGVFDWRSHHHLATVGLQARDLELGGVAGADLVVAAGLDLREVPSAGWDRAPVVTLAPGALGPAAEALRGARRRPAMPPLRTELARVTQEGWAHPGTPLAPSAVTRAYAAALGAGGLVAADPGTAGYWVARTFATTSLGGAVVPAAPDACGLAAACVAVARRRWPGRPALAVTDAVDDRTASVIDAAARWGVAVPVERWSDDGPALDADTHAARLAGLLASDRPAPAALATDPRQLDEMVEVAGDVVAWTSAMEGLR